MLGLVVLRWVAVTEQRFSRLIHPFASRMFHMSCRNDTYHHLVNSRVHRSTNWLAIEADEAMKKVPQFSLSTNTLTKLLVGGNKSVGRFRLSHVVLQRPPTDCDKNDGGRETENYGARDLVHEQHSRVNRLTNYV